MVERVCQCSGLVAGFRVWRVWEGLYGLPGLQGLEGP